MTVPLRLHGFIGGQIGNFDLGAPSFWPNRAPCIKCLRTRRLFLLGPLEMASQGDRGTCSGESLIIISNRCDIIS